MLCYRNRLSRVSDTHIQVSRYRLDYSCYYVPWLYCSTKHQTAPNAICWYQSFAQHRSLALRHTIHYPLHCFTLLCKLLTWRSFIGFQSCSTKMTVSAPVRLRPRPPTCVVSSRTSMDGSLLNLTWTQQNESHANSTEQCINWSMKFYSSYVLHFSSNSNKITHVGFVMMQLQNRHINKNLFGCRNAYKAAI